MLRKKTATKKAKAAKTKKVAPVRKQSTFASIADYLKLGESYSSLVLGIIAVIIGTMLILSVIHANQAGRMTPEVTPTIAQSQSFAISPTGVMFHQPEEASVSPVATVTPTPGPVKIQNQAKQGTYTVVAGDNLWAISEKQYGSGFNWVDIAKANNLADPGDIHVGDKLIMPGVALKDATVQTADEQFSRTQQKSIRTETYTVVSGDNLWGIALRAYGDGYQWVKIAKANNLANPDVIHKDNVLKIPRN